MMLGQWTYLVYELAWALPVILGQWALAHRTLRAYWRVVVPGIAIPTLYLCAADVLAIHIGIWSLHPELTLNIWLGGLPLEEGVFFLVTNVMVVQGIVMLVCKPPA
ncbi:MAG: lycopene cyclase domain-containing protein [Chloroflexi bacterium]|nr:lycopene cyclase domain-containing protein [Chloroflexota bacterium]